jgi:NAD(P)-dependent dehydrogenase (short-subunit alcohol dehydrogenase family)
MGIAYTRAFLAQGGHVVALDRSWERIDLVELGSVGKGVFLEADVTSDSQLDAAFDATLAAFGTVDALVNNTAIERRLRRARRCGTAAR